MMKRIFGILLMLFCLGVVYILTAAYRKADEKSVDVGEDISGLYVEDKEHGNGNGLEITALGDDEYTVQLVQVDDFKVIERAEFQSAYVRKKMEEQTFYFHWYTGVPDKIESRDKFHDIVVYHVTVDHGKLAGYYYYISPNQLQGYEKTDIIFYKIEN